jgi:apolipoprotein N-acyltransferase
MSTILKDWYRSSFGQAMVGAVLLWAAVPPLSIWPLAWVAPLWWVMLIRRENLPSLSVDRPARIRPWMLLAVAVVYFFAGLALNAWFHSMKYQNYWIADTGYWLGLVAIFLAGARLWAAHPYRSLWLAGMFFWLAALQWIRLPYWAVGFGWLALGIYFGFYLPVFIGVSRFAVHSLRVPVFLAAPIVYTALELAQAHLLSGMTMGCLEHTQYHWTQLIQISDLTGCYGVTFLMVFVAACLARMLPCDRRPWAIWPLAPAAALVVAVLAYGHLRTAHAETDPGLKIALIQGKIDIQLGNSENYGEEVVYAQYHDLTRQALGEFPRADLIVWPETAFCRSSESWHGWVTGDPDAVAPPGGPDPQKFRDWLDSWKKGTCNVLTETAREFGRPMIVGVDREHFTVLGVETFNTAVLVTPDGKWCAPDRIEQSYYDKMHLVPFGEYMPLVRSLPWLQNLTPLCVSSCPGEKPKCFEFKSICLVPNICYETVMPHVIRNQLVAIQQERKKPQVLVNITNDGWFWGSSELEMHLACSVYRTVECRLPMVIAANTGISASIDASGRILDEGPRRDSKLILADVRLDRRSSWYLEHGDLFSGGCLAVTLIFAAAGMITARRRR